MPADRSRLRADSGKLSTVNVEQMVEEFVKQVDLEQLCSIDGITPLLAERSGKNNPVSRPSNCFFQFKRIVSQYATQRCIPGYNDQNILSKAQSKLWSMTSNEQKAPFKKLAEDAKIKHKEMYPDYEFHPHRDKSVLKIKMNHGGQQKKKKNPVEKPDQRNKNLLIHQDSTISSPDSNEGEFDFVDIQEDVYGQTNALFDNSTTYALQSPINNDSDARMGSQDELMVTIPEFVYTLQSPEFSATLQQDYPVSPIVPISPAISDCPMLIVTGSEVSSPYPSPIASQIGDNNNFDFPSMTSLEHDNFDLTIASSMEPTTPLNWPVVDNNNMLMINMNNSMNAASLSSSPTLSYISDSTFSLQPSPNPNMDNMDEIFPSPFPNLFSDCSYYIPDTNNITVYEPSLFGQMPFNQ
ncbi:8824_t:CDS:1 [Gigaspora margarita]|uniref:8824_t:CDS:1 n=1 Tax=Gigaspora margarita TaxID=4874 RepID=A0ABM8VXZ3_GIGMA|nr:8824_t:CDS:1 [Gigaspora margarita]